MPTQEMSTIRRVRARPFDEPLRKRALDAAARTLSKLDAVTALLGPQRQSIKSPPTTSDRDEIKVLSGSDPAAFARLYFTKNVVKCSIAATVYSSYLRNVRRVIDLGTGAGTFLFPFAVSLKNHEFVGIDKSYVALGLAAQAFEAARLPPPLLICAQLPGAISGGGQFFTASYLLAELDDFELYQFARFAASRTDAQFLIVDYPDVALRFHELVGRIRPCTAQIVATQLEGQLRDRVGDDHISFGTAYAPAITSRYRAVPG